MRSPKPSLDGHRFGGPGGKSLAPRGRVRKPGKPLTAIFPKIERSITHQLAMKVSDSSWHQQLSQDCETHQNERSPYWLRPFFENYNTFCPYLVGSTDHVLPRNLRDINTLGYLNFHPGMFRPFRRNCTMLTFVFGGDEPSQMQAEKGNRSMTKPAGVFRKSLIHGFVESLTVFPSREALCS